MITLVIFSKDRAMQLDSLLRSVKDHCTGIEHIAVLFRATSPLHNRAYDKLIDSLDSSDKFVMTLWPETVESPSQQLLAALQETEPDHVGLAVDDQIFYAPSDFKRAAKVLDDLRGFVWSWRLGRRTDYDYFDDDDYWITSPLTPDPDYGYVFHSDGALYQRKTYVQMLDRYLPAWRTGHYIPNDLEAVVAAQKARWGVSVGPHLGPLQPTCITWQLNRVQTRYGSPAAEIHATNTDALAEAFVAGKRVDNARLYADLSWRTKFNPPGARPTHVYACEEASKFYAEGIR